MTGLSEDQVAKIIKTNDDSQKASKDKKEKIVRHIFTVTIHFIEGKEQVYYNVFNVIARDDIEAKKKALAIWDRDMKAEGVPEYILTFCEIEYGCALDEL